MENEMWWLQMDKQVFWRYKKNKMERGGGRIKRAQSWQIIGCGWDRTEVKSKENEEDGVESVVME